MRVLGMPGSTLTSVSRMPLVAPTNAVAIQAKSLLPDDVIVTWPAEISPEVSTFEQISRFHVCPLVRLLVVQPAGAVRFQSLLAQITTRSPATVPTGQL